MTGLWKPYSLFLSKTIGHFKWIWCVNEHECLSSFSLRNKILFHNKIIIFELHKQYKTQKTEHYVIGNHTTLANWSFNRIIPIQTIKEKHTYKHAKKRRSFSFQRKEQHDLLTIARFNLLGESNESGCETVKDVIKEMVTEMTDEERSHCGLYAYHPLSHILHVHWPFEPCRGVYQLHRFNSEAAIFLYQCCHLLRRCWVDWYVEAIDLLFTDQTLHPHLIKLNIKPLLVRNKRDVCTLKFHC